jgi:CRP-like cAMP-binding protein
MSASSSHRVAERGCANCIMRGLGLCRVLIDLGWEQPPPDEAVEISQNRVPFFARRSIFHSDESMDCVPVICEGWAASMLGLSDGRRQILSFLLPGEMVAPELLFDRQLHCSIEAVTRGSYRNFNRAQLRAAMFVSPRIFDRMLSAFNDSHRQAERLITDLGRRTATERVARMLIDLWDRLKKLNMTEGNGVEFPLRQTQIADATGITPVYVNAILNDLRTGGLVDISDGSLQILDMARLSRLAM